MGRQPLSSAPDVLNGIVATTTRFIAAARHRLSAYLAHDDRFAGIANTGAFIVWSNQPFYPLYVAWLVGSAQAWPSLITWLSTSVFFAVPIVSRRNSLAGRSLFVVAGLTNTLLSLKAFGPGAGLSWFFVPCFVIAATFFRTREWRFSLTLTAIAALCLWTASRLGIPLHRFSADDAAALARLNIYSVVALTLYLGLAAIKIRLAPARAIQTSAPGKPSSPAKPASPTKPEDAQGCPRNDEAERG